MTKVSATPDNAVLLLGAASELGLDKQVVQMKFGNLTAPDEVLTKAGFSIDAESGWANLGDTSKPSTGKKVAAQKVTEPSPTKAPAKKATTRKTTAKKTAAKKTTTARAEKE